MSAPSIGLAYVQGHRGFRIRGFFDGRIEIDRDWQPFRRWEVEPYKIWNWAAHFTDSVDNFIAIEGPGPA